MICRENMLQVEVAATLDFTGPVVKIDTDTGHVFGNTIPTGATPAWMSVTPDGSTVVTGNLQARTLTIIDTATRSVRATVNMGPLSVPEYGGIPCDGKTFWSTNGDGTVWVVDLRPASRSTYSTTATSRLA